MRLYSRVITILLTVTLILFATSKGQAQVLTIPQIADGGGWQTTLVLTNTSATATSASLTFFEQNSDSSTQSWSLPLQESVSAQSLSLAAGGTLFLHTQATSSATSVGWGQLQASSDVAAYAIFTYRSSGQPDEEGTASAVAATRRILVPFDNTSGLQTAIAVINPTGVAETPTVSIKTDSGVTTSSLPSIPGLGHASFYLPQQFASTAGQRGLMEFDSGATGSLSMIGLSFNPTGAFTTAPVYPESGAPIISGSSSGGGGGGTLPIFTSVSVTGTFSPQGLPSYPMTITLVNVAGTYIEGAFIGATNNTSLPVLTFGVVFSSVTVNGQTFTLNNPTSPGSNMGSVTGLSPVTSGTLTLTLSSTGNSGTISGSATIVSSLGTLSGALSGTYTAIPQ